MTSFEHTLLRFIVVGVCWAMAWTTLATVLPKPMRVVGNREIEQLAP